MAEGGVSQAESNKSTSQQSSEHTGKLFSNKIIEINRILIHL